MSLTAFSRLQKDINALKCIDILRPNLIDYINIAKFQEISGLECIHGGSEGVEMEWVVGASVLSERHF